MNAPMPVNAAGAAPHFGNFYVWSWSVINFAVIIGIVILIIWYVKQRADFRKQLLARMDSLISLLQERKNDKQ